MNNCIVYHREAALKQPVFYKALYKDAYCCCNHSRIYIFVCIVCTVITIDVIFFYHRYSIVIVIVIVVVITIATVIVFTILWSRLSLSYRVVIIIVISL